MIKHSACAFSVCNVRDINQEELRLETESGVQVQSFRVLKHVSQSASHKLIVVASTTRESKLILINFLKLLFSMFTFSGDTTVRKRSNQEAVIITCSPAKRNFVNMHEDISPIPPPGNTTRPVLSPGNIQEATTQGVQQVQGPPENEPQDINNDLAVPQPGGSLPNTEVEESQTGLTSIERTMQVPEINVAEIRKDCMVILKIFSFLRLAQRKLR